MALREFTPGRHEPALFIIALTICLRHQHNVQMDSALHHGVGGSEAQRVEITVIASERSSFRHRLTMQER